MKRAFCLAVVLATASSAGAQTYQATVLPAAPGHAWTIGTGAGGSTLAGYGAFPDTSSYRAVLFNASGYVDVTPNGFSAAIINDSDGAQHGGGASTFGAFPAYAFLWQGTQPVNLHPP